MSDIRERHVMGHADPDQGCEPVCVCCETLWPCEVIQQADRADTAEKRTIYVYAERDAARADADRLAEALDLYPRDFHARAHDRAVDWRECSQPSCAMASKAIAAHVEATR